MAIAVGISIVLAIALAITGFFLWRAYQRLHELDADIAALAREIEQDSEELRAVINEVAGSRIVVEVINPMTLARARSRVGGALVGVAPRLIRRRVYDIIAREMKDQLNEQGVEARVEIFHPTGS